MKKLFGTVFIVTALGTLERFFGFLYRVYLSRTIGAEGVGVYQIALSVIGVLVTLSASGIPITVSRLMLKERANKNAVGESDVISAGILTSLLISVPAVLCLYAFRDKLSFIFADDRCYDVLVLMLPGVIITGVYAVIRGYFWGNRYYLTYSLIELVEEASMVIVGIILVSRATDVFDGAKKAGVSVFVSYVVSFCLSSLVFVLRSGKLTNPIRQLRPLIVSSSPITATRTLTSLMGSLVAMIIPSRLVFYGATQQQALSAFGEMSGMALPLLFMPSTFIGSFALVILPEISENFYGGKIDLLAKNAKRAFDFSVVISALVIPVFIGCGKDIGSFIYSSERSGVYLAFAAVIMLPMSVSMITNSLLNSVNKERFTFVCYLVSAALMLACVYFLPKYIGVYSLVVGYLVSYVATSVINLIAFNSFCGKKFRYKKTLFLSLLSLLPCATFCYLLRSIFARSLPTVLTIGFSGVASIAFSALLLGVFGVIDFKGVFAFLRESGKEKFSRRQNKANA